MTRAVTFSCDFALRGKERHRTGRHGSYTPKRTVADEAAIGHVARAEYRAELMAGPVRIDVSAVYAMPPSWPKKKRRALNRRPHTRKPDTDNALKLLKDALNGVIYLDDRQVSDIHFRKRWAERDGFCVVVQEIGGADA